jgi:hypothetical protein
LPELMGEYALLLVDGDEDDGDDTGGDELTSGK